MGYVRWAAAITASFTAGALLMPVVRSVVSDDESDRPAESSRAQPQLDRRLLDSSRRVEQRLLALEGKLSAPPRNDDTAGVDPKEPAGSPHEGDPAGPASQAEPADVHSMIRAEQEALASAPPPREMIAAALRKGIVNRQEVSVFHARLDELPIDERPVLLREFQSAINEGKIRLVP